MSDQNRASGTDEVLVEREATTSVITINRPDALNALAPSTVEGLNQALRAEATDRSVRAIVLTGSGERAFCAGADVKGIAQRDAADGAELDPITGGFENLHLTLSGITRLIHSLPIPVIAAVNGHCIGAGFAYASACDMRIGSTNAKFANGFVRRGISGAEMGLSYFLPRIVSPAVAFDWMMTGRRVEADEAHAAGLISDVTEPDALVSRAVELGAALAENAPMAVAMTKEVMWANLHAASLDQAIALESRTQVMTRNTADAREARNAFLEKRSPEFGTPDAPRVIR